MSNGVTRREFLIGSGAATAVGLSGCMRGPRRRVSPNEKLNIGIIGVANRGAANLGGVEGENIAALCDVDAMYLREAAQRFPRAKKYTDFRKLLEQGDLDAVVVSTPDHLHAFATSYAIEQGLHVYCEKPLTHSVSEARHVTRLARKYGVTTQMGTQIHAGNNYRRVVELVQSGAIGSVTECHVWIDKTWSGGERPTETPPVPANIDWDLWLGPAPERPYHPTYLPANWRRWWDFGTGTLGDMACHYMDLPFWALELKYPEAVETIGPEPDAETTPAGLTVRWEFPKRGKLAPVALTWYDTGVQPARLVEDNLPKWANGVLFVGDKGMLLADYNNLMLLPENEFEGFIPPEPWLADSVGHHQEWIQACKTGDPTTCQFDYSGPLAETVLLGNVAFRAGQRLDWNARRLKARGCPEADALIEREYRRGWSL